MTTPRTEAELANNPFAICDHHHAEDGKWLRSTLRTFESARAGLDAGMDALLEAADRKDTDDTWIRRAVAALDPRAAEPSADAHEARRNLEASIVAAALDVAPDTPLEPTARNLALLARALVTMRNGRCIWSFDQLETAAAVALRIREKRRRDAAGGDA